MRIAARVQGELTRVTQDAADDYDPTLSGDGATLVYRSQRGGRFGVLMKRLGTTAETLLTRMPEDHYPALSHDGTKVAYSYRRTASFPCLSLLRPEERPTKCATTVATVEEWSPDGGRITVYDGPGSVRRGHRAGRVRRTTRWLRHPGYGIYNPRLSRRMALDRIQRQDEQVRASASVRCQVQPSAVAPESEWIVISRDADAPGWSPDASLLYFWSDRDGSPCLWAQRLDPATKHPTGEPLSIRHFHSRGLSWKNLYLGAPDVAVAPDKIVFNLGEHTGNIWMTHLPGESR